MANGFCQNCWPGKSSIHLLMKGRGTPYFRSLFEHMAKHQFHFYQAFGWKIKSEIPLPELTVADESGNSNVVIVYAEVPKELEGAARPGKNTYAKKGQFLFIPNEDARFWVINGNEVRVWKNKQFDETELRSYILASVFGAIAHQRGMLPLHGSAVAHNGYAHILCGTTGSGKSTTAAALHEIGLAVFAEDLSAIEMHRQNGPLLNFGSNRMKLMEDALLNLGYNPEKFERLPYGLNKFSYPVNKTIAETKLPIKHLYILSKENTDRVTIKELNKIDCLRTALHHTFRQRMVAGLGIQKEHFNHCQQLCDNVKAFSVQRPSTGNSIGETAQSIAAHIKSN